MSSPARRPGTERDRARARALVEEACRKSSILWLRPETASRAVAAWHTWADGAVLLVSGGIEQDLSLLDGLGDGSLVIVTARSKDNGARLATWAGELETVLPEDERWQAAAAELHAKRLNPPDGEGQPDRWARESRITRIIPTGQLLESPGRMPTGSLAAEPVPSPATTRGPLPFVVGRRARRRR